MIQLGFYKEQRLIDIFEERGDLLRELQYNKANEIFKKRVKALMDEHPEAMMRPTKAYITYENPQTLNLLSRLAALEKWDEQIDKEKSLNIEQAANPDDIQHENMNRRKGCKNCCHVSWT